MGAKARRIFPILLFLFLFVILIILVTPRWTAKFNPTTSHNESCWWGYQYQMNKGSDGFTLWTAKNGSSIKVVQEDPENRLDLQGFKKSVNQIKINQAAFILAVIATLSISASAIWFSKVSRPILLSIFLLMGGSLLSSILFYNAYMNAQDGDQYFEKIN